MANTRDRLKLWRDSSLPGGMDVLRASCFDYRYPAHSHDEFVIAAFVRGAQRHRIARYQGIAEPGTVMIIPPGEVHTGEAVECDLGWDYCAFYPTVPFIDVLAADILPGRAISTLDTISSARTQTSPIGSYRPRCSLHSLRIRSNGNVLSMKRWVMSSHAMASAPADQSKPHRVLPISGKRRHFSQTNFTDI
ncbi:AraC family ligand binding domain-containing protein [Acetobacter oryzifermentans]|uniref:AraC family ligand binding domain-containing protein n=1 Tax=Acetobacter oryzifermentans TaxID=1633874 RepID=UPI00346456CB